MGRAHAHRTASDRELLRLVGIGAHLVVLVLTGCGREAAKPAGGPARERVSDSKAVECEAGASSTPPAVRHARLFALDSVEGFRTLSVWSSGRDQPAEVYILAPRSCAVEVESEFDSTVVRIPVRRLATTSTTEIPFLDALGELERLVAHAGVRYVTNPRVHARFEDGSLIELGPSGSLDLEFLVASRAEVVLASPAGDPWLETLRDLGRVETRLVEFPSFREETALGRAEWILAVGALLDREEQASDWFREVERRYEALVDRASELGPGPRVITGAPTGGIWFAPARRSFLADLLRDSRGRSVWEPLGGGVSEPLDLEAAFALGADAEVWLQPGSFDTIRELRDSYPRLVELPALKSGRVWNNDARVTGEWANDYWETGAARPDMVLADLVSIFHPGSIDHRPIFHRRLPPD